MSALRKCVLPAFKQRFEAAPSYADFAAPALAAVAAAVNTADKRAALDRSVLAKNLGILSSRIVAASSRQTPDPTEAAAIASLPEELRTPLGAMNAAIAADDSNTKLKVWRCALKSSSPDELAGCVKAAARANPEDATLFNFMLSGEFKKGLQTRAANPLEAPLTIDSFGTKTSAEWFGHGVQLDEYNVFMWHSVMDCLGFVHETDRQMIGQQFHSKAAEQMKAAKDDQERQQIQKQVMGEMQMAMPPRPKFFVHGQAFDRAMAAARVLQIREMHITAFGEDVVTAGRFDQVPLPLHPARAHYNDACKLLVSELESDEEITIDTFKKSPSTGELVVSGTRTVTAVSALGEVVSSDKSDGRLWGSLADAMHRKGQDSVDIDGQTLSVLECAANACERMPTQAQAWDLLLMVMVRRAFASMQKPEQPSSVESHDSQVQLALAVRAQTVTIRGVTLPGHAIKSIMQAPPKTEEEFAETLVQFQDVLKS